MDMMEAAGGLEGGCVMIHGRCGLVHDLGPWHREVLLGGGAGGEKFGVCKGFHCFHCRQG